MDLGSLELQIFVSLTVVLGGAFIALICDYLKGNNEQLREHNIELRVRKEEQERRMVVDPAVYLNQVAAMPKPALGAIATEFLILGVDPDPRKQGVAFDPPDTGPRDPGPFAALAALKEKGGG